MTAPRQTGGDDLDDGLELDPTLLASESEDGFGDEAEDGAGYLSAEDMEVEAPKGVKRKASEDEDEVVGEVDADAAAAKRKRRREKDKARRAAKVCFAMCSKCRSPRLQTGGAGGSIKALALCELELPFVIYDSIRFVIFQLAHHHLHRHTCSQPRTPARPRSTMRPSPRCSAATSSPP
jgi:protein CMS1